MPNNQSNSSPNLSFSPKWLNFISISLRPIIRLLVKNKVEFKTFINLCRELFVEEAEAYINKTTTNNRGKISSIAFQTGMDRREVSNVLKTSNSVSCATEKNRSREGFILDHWSNDPMFCDEKGKPLPLKRSGTGLSFETLVQRFGKNISHGPILNELLNAKCVKIKNEKVQFCSEKYTPSGTADDKKASIASLSINRLASTIEHNLSQNDDLWFQRNLYSIRIRKSQINDFRKELNNFFNDTLINYITPKFNEFESKHQTNIKEEQSEPIGLGLFFFQQQPGETP